MDLPEFFKVFAAVHFQVLNLCHKNHFHGGDLNYFGTFVVIAVNADSKIVKELPLKNLETFLVDLICDATFFTFAKHGLTTSHVVGHYILKNGEEAIRIQSVEKDELINCYLNFGAAFQLVDHTLTLQFQLMVDSPEFFFLNKVELQLKEKNFA
jgi:hypothetical protein